jgi:fructokinase
MTKRIGIDLGGTKTEIILTGEDPLDIIHRRRVPTQQEKGYPFILQQLVDLINECLSLCKEIPLIGVGIPGSISPVTDLVRNANTTCLNGNPLKKDLESRLNLPVYMENDANCFALSEALSGAGKGYQLVLGLIMGTGMGGGVVRKGKILQGRHGILGEFGHISIDHAGRDCWCGQKGCLERYISGPAVEQQYKEKAGIKTGLREIYQKSLTGKDAVACEVIDEFLAYFGRGLASLITAFDPDVVVIGGGLSNIPLLYSKGAELARKQVFSDECSTPIVQNLLGDSSGIFGAALLAGP